MGALSTLGMVFRAVRSTWKWWAIPLLGSFVAGRLAGGDTRLGLAFADLAPALSLPFVAAAYAARLVSRQALMVLAGLQGVYTLMAIAEEARRLQGGRSVGMSWVALASELDVYVAIPALIAGIVIAGLSWFLLQPPGMAAARLRAAYARLAADRPWLAAGSGEHGTARLATRRETREMFPAAAGIVIGAEPGHDRDALGETMLRDAGEAHVMVIGGSGSGKSQAIAIPTALDWVGPMVAFDPKGELYRASAAWRRGLPNHKVVRIDAGAEGSASIDILDWLDPSREDVVQRASAVAGWLIEDPPLDGGGNSKFFIESARALVTFAILRGFHAEPTSSDGGDLDTLLAATTPEEIDRALMPAAQPAAPPASSRPTMKTVHAFLTLPSDVMKKALRHEFDLAEVAKAAGQMPRSFGALGQLGGALSSVAEETFTSIVVTATTSTRWMVNPTLARIVSGETGERLPTSAITEGDTTVYLCVDPSLLLSDPAYMRVLLGSLVSPVYQPGSMPKQRILYLLDEAPRLGKADYLTTARDIGRGYNVTLLFIAQDLGQIEERYGRAGMRGWLESSRVKIVLGVNDQETAAWASSLAGETTVAATGFSDSGLGGTSSSTQKRPVLTPDEILRLGPTKQLVFLRDRPAAVVEKPLAWKSPLYKARMEPHA